MSHDNVIYHEEFLKVQVNYKFNSNRIELILRNWYQVNLPLRFGKNE